METYDISTEGCMLQASNDFCEIGDEIEIAINSNMLKGRIVWVKNRNAGVQFAGSVLGDTFAAIFSADDLTQPLALASKAPPAAARRMQLAVYGVLALSSILLLLQ